jgi:hypothetical protein
LLWLFWRWGSHHHFHELASKCNLSLHPSSEDYSYESPHRIIDMVIRVAQNQSKAQSFPSSLSYPKSETLRVSSGNSSGHGVSQNWLLPYVCLRDLWLARCGDCIKPLLELFPFGNKVMSCVQEKSQLIV